MSAGLAYGLGVLTPIAALALWAAQDWARDEAKTWWRQQRPTLGRVRCTLAGHDFHLDHGWIICRRCGHAKDEPRRSTIFDAERK